MAGNRFRRYLCLVSSLGTLHLANLAKYHVRLQEETARVEEHLLDGSFAQGIIRCFTTSKANAFENLLEPLQKLLRLSPPVALSLAHPDLFSRILQKLQSSKAVVRLNLLRIIRSICDASEDPGSLLNRYDLLETIQRLAECDGAVLVRNMAGELLKSSETSDRLGMSSNKRRGASRRPSSSTTPPSLLSTHSMPPTPTSNRSMHSTNYFLDREPRERGAVNGRLSYRPASREGIGVNGSPIIVNGSGPAVKSRLPRTTSRTSQQPIMTSPKKEENIIPTTVSHQSPAPNSRRRRHASGEGRWT